MEIKELQEKAEEIITALETKKDFNYNKEFVFIHLVEEVGEVARQILNPNIKRDGLNVKKLEEELADIFLLAARLANKYNIDLDSCIKNKIQEFKDRNNL